MQTETQHYLIAAIFTMVGALVAMLGFFKLKTYLIIKDTPRSKIRSMAMGIVEIHGTIACFENNLIKTPFSKTDCVYYKYEIEEYRQHTSGSGKNRRTEHRWDTVAWGDKGIPFMAKDDTGEVYVDPHGAETYITKNKGFYLEKQGLLAGFGGIGNLVKALRHWDGKDMSGLAEIEVMDLRPLSQRTGLKMTRVGDRRFLEYYIEPGDTLFLLGTAANNRNVPQEVLIKKGENEKTFIISDREEMGVLKELKKSMLVALIFGSIFFIVGVIMFLKITGIV
nr:hypothetical protein [candidate division Zixibacteria bacterium]